MRVSSSIYLAFSLTLAPADARGQEIDFSVFQAIAGDCDGTGAGSGQRIHALQLLDEAYTTLLHNKPYLAEVA